MAVSTTFKQPCPSCEALVTIKENMVGKKVECTKCKDKFVAQKPVEDKKKTTASTKKDTSAPKKNTSLQKKSQTGVTSKTPPPGKRPKMVVEDAEEVDELEEIDELEEVDELDEVDEEPVQVKSSKGKPPASNGKGKPAASVKGKKADENEEEEDEDEEEAEAEEKSAKKSKKKAAGSNKLTMGLALAVVGVIVLCVAAFFLLRGRPSGGNNPPMAGNQGGDDKAKGNDTGKPAKSTNTGGSNKNNKSADMIAVPLTDVEMANLSNLLPNDTEHVFHVFFKELFNPNLSLRDAVFDTPGALVDADVRKKVGFSLQAIDDLIHAERYSLPSWSYTVVHFKDVLQEDDLKAALKLIPLTAEGQTYYRTNASNPWFEQLARFSFAVPKQQQMYSSQLPDRPTYLRFHNSQTLIVGDESPIVALLKAKGQFAQLSQKGTGTTTPNPGTPPPMPGVTPMPMGGTPNPVPPAPLPADKGSGKTGSLSTPKQFAGTATVNDEEAAQPSADSDGCQQNPNPDPKNPDPKLNPNPDPKNPDPKTNPAQTAGSPRESMYLTIKPVLKSVLDRMESRGGENKDTILISSATDMDANRVTEIQDRVVRRPRLFWDVAMMLNETKPRIRLLGTSLVKKDDTKFQYRNELTCAQELDVKEFQQEITRQTAFNVANFIFQITKHSLRLPGDNPAPPMKDGGGQPPNANTPPDEKKPAPEVTASQITLNPQSNTLEFVMDLVLDSLAQRQIDSIATLTASALRVDMEAAATVSMRHLMARAGLKLAKDGVTIRDVRPGQPTRKLVEPGVFPPGAFPRENPTAIVQHEPKNRLSFMVGMLPYMGHQNLFDRIRFDQSWRDPGNWMAGQTSVPQFLDPAYPPYTRFVNVGDMPIDFGATHYVGIAGVGLDAASYKRGHAATAHKQGIFSYDGSASISEVSNGTGLSNTIMMLEVPYDSMTGVSPWIAGGGATLRGVPEKNSIAPFVSEHQKKRGTYALMADGTVRFIEQTVSDEVFKAMCTVNGPFPAKFDLNKDSNTPLVLEPTAGGKKPVAKPAAKPQPVKQVKAPTDDPAADLQGIWSVTSMQMDGLAVPEPVVAKMRFIFKADKLIMPGKAGEEVEVAYKIDPKKSPRQLDITSPKEKTALLSIYELKADELKICFRESDHKAGRPTAFVSQPQTGTVFITLKKQK